MTIVERIFQIMKDRNIKQKDFALAIGANEKTVSSWKKRGTKPAIELIVPIARELKVSIPYLLTGEDTLESELPLSSDEMKLLENYRMLDHKQKTAVYEHASDLAKLAQLEENEALRQESAS